MSPDTSQDKTGACLRDCLRLSLAPIIIHIVSDSTHSTYFSGFVTSDYASYPQPPYKGKHWTIDFAPLPAGLPSHGSTNIDGIVYPVKAVMIEAASQEAAQAVADLLSASICLSTGQPFALEWGRFEVVAVSEGDLIRAEDSGDRYGGPMYFFKMGLPRDCLIARQCSFRRDLQYAIFKYSLSHEVFSTSASELDPSHWMPCQAVLGTPEHHVRCSAALTVAYSVLEELSLEVRASRKRPSFVNGKWNLEVKQELENRLRGKGIDCSQQVVWVLRGTPTRIERTRHTAIGQRASWAGYEIRDRMIPIVDALAYASWLRNKVSAHRLRKLSRSLTYYDVHNVQSLARRLLLQMLGYWGSPGAAKRQV